MWTSVSPWREAEVEATVVMGETRYNPLAKVGRSVQVHSIKTHAESAYGFSA